MKNILKILLILGVILGSAHISKAQNANYILSVKGDKVLFDSAVIVNLSQYRKETKYIQKLEGAEASFFAEITQLRTINERISRVLELEKSFSESLQKTQAEKELLIKNQTELIATLKTEATKKVPFYKNPYLAGAIGVLLTAILLK